MEHIVRNGRPVSFGLRGTDDGEIASVSQRVAAKITSVAVGTLTIGVLGTLVGAGISLLDTKKLRPATVGQGAMVGAALGGAMGLFAEVNVRSVKTAGSKDVVSP
jgi:hypothetical protein